ncbi:MAG: T9SS type A sorting domain-containing protein [Bacteroidales bacterium]|nr:T9SS type A sorting domain-containing protein [Bacteroidales bacterium]
MKKLKRLLFFLLFVTTYTHAQWEVQLDLQNFTYLDRIFFLDENYGWANGGATIGSASPYFYTTDGGENWYLCDDWMDRMGTDIVFVNPDTGFIAASNGIIRKTVNGGQTWTDIQTPATQDVMRLFFVDENNGWATLNNFTDSSQIVHTIDGGNTWYLQQVFEINTSSILPIYFLNDSIGYGGGGYYDIENGDSYSSIVKTQNKGETWEIIYLSQNTFYSIDDIFFRDTLIGWAVGQKSSINTYLILHTEDGGETWQEQSIAGTLEPSRINCVYFVNDTTGWIGVGEVFLGISNYGAIYFTNDSGENWQLQQEFNMAVLDIQMLNQDTGWAVGCDFIYHTTNGDTIIITGIEEKIDENDLLQITPNPTNGVFTIIYNYHSPEADIYQLTITDITGKTILNSTRRQAPVQIDISSHPAGIYFLTIQFQKNNKFNFFTQKIVKL